MVNDRQNYKCNMFRIGSVLLACFLLVLPTLRAQAQYPPDGPRDSSFAGTIFGRDFVRVPVPGARCGDGEDYVMFVSRGPETVNGEPNNRLVIWLAGGGSTQIDVNGNLDTPILNESILRDRLTPPETLTESYVNDRDFIFSVSHDDDAFVKNATWVILPYCTQDFHSGNLNVPIRYDFSSQRQLVRDFDIDINRYGIDRFHEEYPYVDVEGHITHGFFIIDKLYVNILHDGAEDVQLSINLLFDMLQNSGFDLSHADVLMAGSSAGGFGVWYDAWMVGDILYQYPDAKLTLSPESGSPNTMLWSDSKGDLIFNTQLVQIITQRVAWYDVVLPSEVIGGDYTGGGKKSLDVLDLLDHYNLRWSGMDVKFVVTMNKEDAEGVAALGLGSSGFETRLLRFCKTVHRYSQYVSMTDNSYIYMAWLFYINGHSIDRVHGFKLAAGTVPLTGVTGENSAFGDLEYINMAAARTVHGPAQIANVAGVVTDPVNLYSPVYLRTGYFQDTDVPWPTHRRPQ